MCTHTHIYKGDLYSEIFLQELFRTYYTPSPQKQKSSSLLFCSTSERSRIARKVKRQGFVMRGRVCVDKSNLTGKNVIRFLLTCNGETFLPPTIRAAVCPLYSSLDRCFTTWQSCTWERDLGVIKLLSGYFQYKKKKKVWMTEITLNLF